MKKALWITVTTIITLGILSQSALVVKTAEAFFDPAAAARAALRRQLATSLEIPASLPSAIQDPALLEAWVRLYNHQEPIQLWDGPTITGRQLAQFALAHDLPIVWDTARVCKGGDCSLRYCEPHSNVCSFEDRLHPGVQPIYIAPIAEPQGANMQFLVGTLAHEIFHRTAPFGAVSDTKFEEYWAFRIGAAIGRNAAPNFAGIDPLISGELYIWLLKNKLSFYFSLPEYPASAAALVQSH